MVYVVGESRYDVPLAWCRTNDAKARVFTFSPNEPGKVGAFYDDDITLGVAKGPDPVRAGWIASLGDDDQESALSDRAAELVARQVAIWSYIFGAPEFSLADASVLDKSRRDPEGEPLVDTTVLERARALRQQASRVEEPPGVYTDYQLTLDVVRKTYRDYRVVATLKEGRHPINNKRLQFYVNDRKVNGTDDKTRDGRASYGAKKPAESVDIAVEWDVSKSAGKPLRVKGGASADLLLAEPLSAPLRAEARLDPSTFPKASDYVLGEALDWLDDRFGSVGVFLAVSALALLSSIVGLSIGLTVGKRRAS
jgi:hypothetical protein